MAASTDKKLTPKSLWTSLVADPDHGNLPAILVALTVVTGLVDAVSILSLGRVFVANMTGNVVFIGFAIAGAPGFSLAASLSALAGFIVGASGGGALTTRTTGKRHLTQRMLLTELVVIGVGLVLSAIAGSHPQQTTRDLIAAALAIALGVQNAVVRSLKVPDLTTTVLTMTLTGIAADLRTQSPAVVARRVIAVGAMLGGAAVGTVLVLHVNPASALGVAEALIAIGLAATTIRRR